jgi:hypothetical protein
VRALKLQIAVLLALTGLAIVLPLHSRAQQSGGTLSAEEIVSRMEAARVQSKGTAPFMLQREYRLYHGDDSQPMSQVKAEINVVPPHERDYKIVDSKGSDRGEKVVRKILEHEAKAEKSSPPPTAIVGENYDFHLVGQETFQGSRCYVLDLKPKRKDPGLVEGRVWVDASTFLTRKVEGQMSKSPSWWVKGVSLTVLFGEVGGMWMQTSTKAVADIRLVGRYTVAGRATGIQQSSTVASSDVAQKKARVRSRGVSLPAAAIYNTGVLVSR